MMVKIQSINMPVRFGTKFYVDVAHTNSLETALEKRLIRDVESYESSRLKYSVVTTNTRLGDDASMLREYKALGDMTDKFKDHDGLWAARQAYGALLGYDEAPTGKSARQTSNIPGQLIFDLRG